jgi:hypothetical protein
MAVSESKAKVPNFEAYVMGVQRVEELLRKVTTALDASSVLYAVIGGNAVAAWVASVDEDAVRSTKDVDILLRRHDLLAAAEALRPIGLVMEHALDTYMFLDAERPRVRTGVHVVLANQPITPRDTHPAPDPAASTRAAAGYRVVNLLELLMMKLQAFRLVDQVHIQDMRAVKLIDADLIAKLPDDLQQRLLEIPDADTN